MSFSQVADKDNTALFRNYAYIATFDFFFPPQTTALVLDIFRTLSRNRKKNTRLNIISFICAKKKKKASLKNTEINFVLFLQFKNVTEKV